MNDAVHPDEVERLMIALWGPSTPATADAAAHAESCDACGEDVDFHRRLRDALRRLAAAELAPRMKEFARTRVMSNATAAAPDDAWVQAVALPACAGVRSAAAAETQYVCDVPGMRVNVLLHPSGRDGRFALSGQTLREDAAPATGVRVTLYVDRVAAATTTTDSFGEFSFGAHAGSRFGLALAAGGEPSLVELPLAGGAP